MRAYFNPRKDSPYHVRLSRAEAAAVASGDPGAVDRLRDALRRAQGQGESPSR